MTTILVAVDDAQTRGEIAEIVRRCFPRARIIATGVDARPDVDARDAPPIVLADVVAVERVRRWAPAGARLVALTREMDPATLLRAEALGVDASLRAPMRAEYLVAVLERMLASAEAGRSGARDRS